MYQELPDILELQLVLQSFVKKLIASCVADQAMILLIFYWVGREQVGGS